MSQLESKSLTATDFFTAMIVIGFIVWVFTYNLTVTAADKRTCTHMLTDHAVTELDTLRFVTQLDNCFLPENDS